MEHTHKKSKKGLVIGIIVLLVLAGGAFAFYAATSSKTVPAMLHVTDGSATLNGRTVTGTEKLDEDDVVETQNGHASIYLYESTVISMAPNTKVTISELIAAHPKVEQEGGSTWSTFTKLAGVEGYDVKMGTTVASVRGTAFELSNGLIVTGAGTVDYTFDGSTFQVSAGNVVEDGVARVATAEELARINAHFTNAIQELRFLRQLELEKHPILVSTVKSVYGIDDAFINQKLEEADEGKWDVEKARDQAPIHTDSLDKVADITKAIQQLNADMQALNG